MINKKLLKEYMQFIVETYPEGCASDNWENFYPDILSGKREIEDYECSDIIENGLKEFEYEELGMCGCGLPEATEEVIRLILTAQNQEGYQNKKQLLDDICNINTEKNDNYYGLVQFILYVLDDKWFLEHGSSIGGAWLTDKGKILLDLLNWKKELYELKFDKQN